MQSLFRPHILNLMPYSSARDEYTGTEGIFLDANENPYQSAGGSDWNRYPDPYQHQIKTKIAPIKGIQPSQIFLGNGSDEPIDLLIRATCTPQHDNIIILPPTYGMYQVSADVNDVEVKKVPLTADFQIDVSNVLAAVTPSTKIIWICSPNNPTGNAVSTNAILEILQNFNGFVVVDEAYIDFSTTKSFIQYLDQYPNLIVLQTFSKAWGLASLRVGMCFANETVIGILNKIKPPYNLSGPAQKLLIEAIEHESEKNKMVEDILKERRYLAQMLEVLPNVQKVYPSDANFLLVRFVNASETMQYLIDKQIIVRDRSKVTLCEGCLRISVGTATENKLLIEALNKFIQP